MGRHRATNPTAELAHWRRLQLRAVERGHDGDVLWYGHLIDETLDRINQERAEATA